MGDGEATISESEWDLLQALWERGPSTAGDLEDALRGSRGWARSTVKTMLDRMGGKGLVTVRRVGNVREFTAAIRPAEARRAAWRRFVEAAFDGATAPALEFIARDARLTPRQRQELKRLLEEDCDD